MTNETIYIAGPMTGLPDWNYPVFHAAADELREMGYKVLNPAEHFGGATDRMRKEYLRSALNAVTRADIVALLPGWETSEGVIRELQVADALDIPAYALSDFVDAFYVDAKTPQRVTVAPGLSPRADMLREAEKLVTGDRNNSYGPPTQDFKRTAGALTAFGYRGPDGRDLKAHDVALIVATVKMSRLMWTPQKRDSWVDGAGYFACGWECALTEDDE